MKTFRSRGLNLLLLRQAVAGKAMTLVVISTFLLMVLGCVASFRLSSPVLYKPTCDIRPVLKLQLPERIETLAGAPRSETVFENGTNKFGGRLPDDIKEMFYLKQGAVEYKFIVFFNDAAAIKEYGRDKERNIYGEITENGLTGRVHYTEEPRADPEGGSAPMGYYISRADFRLHNLYIRVETKARADEGEKPLNDKLTNAVNDLAQMLKRAFNGR